MMRDRLAPLIPRNRLVLHPGFWADIRHIVRHNPVRLRCRDRAVAHLPCCPLDTGHASPDITSTQPERAMPPKRPHVMDFLQTRRSSPAKTLSLPVPGRGQLEPILAAGLRVPDHGKLEPWHLLVLERQALIRLAGLVDRLGPMRGLTRERVEKTRRQFADAHLAIAVVSAPLPSPKVPASEQQLSAGAVCLSLLNAALASGWGANWLTGWMATDREFLNTGLQLAPSETIAGFIHIGTAPNPTPERPRPDIGAKTTWVNS